MRKYLLVVLLTLFFCLNLKQGTSAYAFDNGMAGFTLKVNGLKQPYQVFAFYLLPKEWLEFEMDTDVLGIASSAGILEKMGKKKWRWRHTKSGGPYQIKITDQQNRTMTLNLFVLIPFRNNATNIEGYRIGKYPEKPLRRNPIYARPKGFVRVTPENKDTLVSPHFKLSQFLCKQDADWPRLLIIKPKLLLKLEELLKLVNKTLGVESIYIMSGYRTPYYNKAIGNVKYSRHLWGDAVDIFIDIDPVDELMDDLNHDGKIDINDAKVLYQIIDNNFRKKDVKPLLGGLSTYRSNLVHGPFVHMDVRGHTARW